MEYIISLLFRLSALLSLDSDLYLKLVISCLVRSNRIFSVKIKIVFSRPINLLLTLCLGLYSLYIY